MNINNEKARQLNMDELEQVSGGLFGSRFFDSRIDSVFDDKDKTKDLNNPAKPVQTNKPTMIKA